MFPTHNWIALFPIDNVGFRTIFYGYSNAFSIRPQIILYIYNFYLVLLVLMQYIYRLYSLYGIYGPMDSQSFVGSYPVNSLLFFVCLTFLLWLLIIWVIFGCNYNLLSTYFCWNFCAICSLGKCFSTKFKNLIPKLVVTLLLSDGLNQIIFRFLCNFLVLFSVLSTFGSIYSNDAWYPDFFNTLSYFGFTELKICLLQEFLETNSLINVGNLFRISGGWFDGICI